ncbi:MAG TPA: hypothetical protein VLM75_09870 [Spirochaetota bacterium]|nr:hypothetical protein [Spirochaetota bacterium]
MAIKEIFQAFFNRKAIIIAVSAGFLAGFITARISTDPYADLLDYELSRYSKGEWIVKIDDDAIGSKYLDNRAALYARYIAPRDDSTDPLFRDKLLRKLVDNYIVVKAAQKAGLFAGENARHYLWMYIEEAIAGYYLDSMADLGKKPPPMTDGEIDEFYKKHEPLFAGKNIPREKALGIIRAGLNDISERLSSRDRTIAGRLELGRLKKGKDILLNHSLIGKKGTAPVPGGKRDN